MADTFTSNFSFTLPEVGASADTWGDKLNANWSSLDTALQNVSDAADAAQTSADAAQTSADAAQTSADEAKEASLWQGGYGSDSGAADAYVVASDYADASYTSLVDGMQVRFRAGNANTGASTVDVDGLGAKTLVTVTGVALPAGYIRTDVDTTITYDVANDRFVADRKEERGSNANGDYVRTAEGHLECRDAFTISSSPVTWTFPAGFSDIPLVFGNKDTLGNPGYVYVATRSSTSVDVHVSNVGNAVQVHAVGSWY